MRFPIYEINDNDFDDFEDMGTKSKFWYTDPVDKQQYLFKSTHTQDKNENPIIRQGEDWAEKVACEIAQLLGIPHAEYDLAIHNNEKGIRSKNFVEKGESLVFGNSLIEKVVEKVLKTPLEEGQRSQEVTRVWLVLNNIIETPPKYWVSTANISSAFDVFIGYIMLDCLISNQDRHNENWALLIDNEGKITLAPSFDHAASLGRNESDKSRQHRLSTNDKNQKVEHYVTKCKSHFYQKGKRLKSIEAFERFTYLAPNAAIEWCERLEKLERHDVDIILDKIPSDIMTDLCKQFCSAIILCNKARILKHKELLVSLREKNEI